MYERHTNLSPVLSEEEIDAIDKAGARGAQQVQLREFAKRLAWVAAFGLMAFGLSFISGMDLL